MTELTICMPVYNGEKYIRESVGSILGQNYGDFILRIYDDGSTDGTVGIINSFHDSRVQIVGEGVNYGTMHARATLINMLDTEYCMWCDADDWFCNSHAFRTAMRIVKSEDYDMVHFAQMNHYYPNGWVWNEKMNLSEYSYFGDRFFETDFETKHQFLFNSKIFKSGLLKACMPEKEIVSQRFFNIEDIFFIPMTYFLARRFRNAAACPAIYSYREGIGEWTRNGVGIEESKVRNVCIVYYNAILSLYNRMTAIRPLSAEEEKGFVARMNLGMFPYKFNFARQHQSSKYADRLIGIWHEYFAADGAHLLNGHGILENRELIETLEKEMKGEK